MTDNELAQSLRLPVLTIRRLISEETTDPRISTLKLIAKHFNVTVDDLIESNNKAHMGMIDKNKPQFVPKLDWETAEKINTSLQDIDLSNWPEWQPIALGKQELINENTFAIESRPSMYPRFPIGTIFIITPNIAPTDGDIVLVRINKNNELTIRELVIDPPQWHLHPVVPGSSVIQFRKEDYKIIGVVVLQMLYNRKIS